MKKLTGWQRLLVVISVAWLVGVMFRAGSDYQAAVNGGDITSLVAFKDSQTGKSFGRLSREKIKRLGELLLEKSKSVDAEPTDAEEAEVFLKAIPEPILRYRAIGLWAFLPIISLWFLYACVSWVIAGFRKAT